MTVQTLTFFAAWPIAVAFLYTLLHYSRQGEACVIPTLLGDLVVMPKSEVAWMASESDAILDADEPHYESIQPDYAFIHPRVLRSPVHFPVVTRDLTRKLGELTNAIAEEISLALEEMWGLDVETWKEIVPFDTLEAIITRASNRAFVGAELCRHPGILAHGKGFSKEVARSSFALRMTPIVLRPMMAKYITRRNREHVHKFIEIVLPVVEARQKALGLGGEEPSDMIQWLIRNAIRLNDPIEQDPFMISARILSLNFAAVNTTTQLLTNALFDVISPPSSPAIIEAVATEARSALNEGQGEWTKEALAGMVRMDSILRESIRLNSFLTVGLTRLVVAPQGVTSPISKTYMPRGTLCGVPSHAVFNDEDQFQEANVFTPFRYSDIRKPDPQTPAAHSERKDSSVDLPAKGPEDLAYIKKANLACVTTSEDYHPWGHGRHACRGRFFAVSSMKLILAHIVLKYDIEMLEERPRMQSVTGAVAAPLCSIKVRRKKGTV
ncbi:hypothetical protein FKW77_000310 [Venturia effusa]|uniref:Cytochrome P450 n=1 Tax=Venturia effusa TaxID=50376 RepID=A0A517L2J6_9PEZI|nr:hypothetical protein FKW77_000310 [Venturia effusa]